MKIANIYPIKNQKMYKKEGYVMILAHLLLKGFYKKETFKRDRGQYIIMDNGLFEKQQVSTNLEMLVNLAENSGILINEIIVPDAVNDLLTTIKLFEQNLAAIEKWHHKYRFMFVAQANDPTELRLAFEYLRRYEGKLNLSIGISKLSPMDRTCKEAIELYKYSFFPIHFLGIKTTFKEILPVQGLIRGCDTSQLAFIDKNEDDIDSIDVLNYERYYKDSPMEDIDLENDVCDDLNLEKLKDKQTEEFLVNGILR